ncbi:metabolite traffic protein EboE [Adhaeribacter aquaticus]|uniref:metabolite traffic protein EboE n=1 Tax=Adhaeribacter aquaticus TaxID=299567 RepID=UPI0003FB360D|nr:metabolite traffic protein EboE [Adhaeribacter aquaticus]
MNIGKDYHLSYCTNIHPGETWAAVFETLQKYILPIKANLSPDKPFGIGLRLSDLASKELEQENHLPQFKNWLQEHDLYVFTMNGFPFGGFHQQVVKDEVHQPDWTTTARPAYTIRLARILAYLLPDGLEGSISTSPLSYKLWFKDDAEKTDQVFEQATRHLAMVVENLIKIKEQTGKLIHIDIEPEPDGLLETSKEFMHYYEEWLLPKAGLYLENQLGLDQQGAQSAIREHIQLCYDVCHFALAYEEPTDVIQALSQKGIKIGKVQISAALKADLPTNIEAREELAQEFAAFNEPTYLHQVIVRNTNNTFTQYNDLPVALEHIKNPEAVEWRSHFHVPVFLDRYHKLQSTQVEIVKVFKLLAEQAFTNHLEVETYTWGVLPEEIKQDLGASIQRELEWVLQNIKVAD